MTLRSVTIDLPPPARLLLASMPGRFEPWPEFVFHAERERLDLVLCLAPRDEVATLSPVYFNAIAQGTLPFRWLEVPMANYGLPADLPGFHDGIDHAAASLLRGQRVLLHCAAGIGRTGTAAACLLKRLGLPVHEALQRVRDAGSNPENAIQSGLVERF